MKRFYRRMRGRRFYPDTYKNHIKSMQWEREVNMDYTKFNVERREIGWGRMRIIGSYPDYILHVNKRKPKRESDNRRKPRYN